MKVLVTGGFGFVGGRLAQLLVDRGDQVRLGTRSDASPPAWLPAAAVVRMDWHSPAALEQACRGVDAVLHLAGFNAAAAAEQPAAARELKEKGTARLVEAAAAAGARRFIAVSTAHVYGALTGTIDESTPPAGTHPYATSNRAGEQIVLAASDRGEIVGTVVRLSNAFGAPARRDADCWTLVINDLCRQAATNGAMTLRSSGMQRRDFIPMSEACRAIDHLLRLPEGRDPRVVNLGGAWAPTVWEAACLVQERAAAVLGTKPALTRAEPRPDEVPQSLDYRAEAMARTGFTLRDDRVPEIDRLIVACRQWFGRQ